jgi:hypothetical protein
MDKLPFGIYDFFAYLSAGAVLLATADYVYALGLLGLKEVSPVLAVALLVLLYVIGQIVAQFSSLLFEQIILGKFLGRPSTLLLGGAARSRVAGFLFPNYHRALPANVQARVREQAHQRNCAAEGEGLFLHAFPLVTANEKLQTRVDIFLNQYGFARNMAFAFLVSALWIAIAHWYGHHVVSLRWAGLAAFSSVSMFYRYLNFFRQYSYELLIRYSELPPATSMASSVGA